MELTFKPKASFMPDHGAALLVGMKESMPWTAGSKPVRCQARDKEAEPSEKKLDPGLREDCPRGMAASPLRPVEGGAWCRPQDALV